MKRAPWLTIFMLAIALTTGLPPVVKAIDHAIGIPEFATLIKVMAGVAAATAVVDGVIATNSPGRPPHLLERRHIPGVLTRVALLVVFLVMPRRETPSFTESVSGGLPAVFLLIFYTYLSAAIAVTAVLYLRAARIRSSPSSRAGMWLVTAACTCGLCFTGWMIGYLALRPAGAPLPGSVTGYLAVADTLEGTSLALLVAGMSIPAIAVGISGSSSWPSLSRRSAPAWRCWQDSEPPGR